MPYLTEKRKQYLDEGGPMQTKGDLTYIAFVAALTYLRDMGSNHDNISDTITALERAAHEVERRVLDPYEDKKILENGDIVLPK